MDGKGCLLVFELEQLCLHLEDNPPGWCGQSERPRVHPVRRLFLRIRS
jgi:hypothetical protein